jgi:NADH-quinone oxidoreductase subunit L
MYFLVFHGKERWMENHGSHHAHEGDHDDEEPSDDHHHGLGPNDKPHESPWVVTLPLALLAIPSVLIGFFAIHPLVGGEFFKGVIFTNLEAHPGLEAAMHHAHDAMAMGLHAFVTLPFWLAAAGVALAWFFYMKAPHIPAAIKQKFSGVHTLLENKYYMDELYFAVFAKGSRALGTFFWKVGDMLLIDGLLVNGSARLVGSVSRAVRKLQTGFIYSYAAVMIIGVLVLMTYWFKPLILR